MARKQKYVKMPLPPPPDRVRRKAREAETARVNAIFNAMFVPPGTELQLVWDPEFVKKAVT